MRLLIAEDDDLFRNILKKALAPEHELVFARDGNQAWEILENSAAPRLALLDWVMPGFTGPELCRKIRACPHLASMYLIIFTARNSTADVVSGLRAGADDYITKPFRTSELRSRIRLGERTLERSGGEAESTGRNHALHENQDLTGWPFRLGQSREANAYVVQDCVLGSVAAPSEQDSSHQLITVPPQMPDFTREKVHV